MFSDFNVYFQDFHGLVGEPCSTGQTQLIPGIVPGQGDSIIDHRSCEALNAATWAAVMVACGRVAKWLEAGPGPARVSFQNMDLQ